MLYFRSYRNARILQHLTAAQFESLHRQFPSSIIRDQDGHKIIEVTG